jgi:hypothetical protein
VLVAVTRSGWLALFMGELMIGDPTILPVLAVVVLPAWLVVTGRPEMVVRVIGTSAPRRESQVSGARHPRYIQVRQAFQAS